MWFIKGYIAHEKGIELNCAKVVISMTRKKFKRKEITRWKLARGSTSKSCSGSGMEGLAFPGDDDVITQGRNIPKKEHVHLKTTISNIFQCPFMVTPIVVTHVQELYDFLKEILGKSKLKVEHLELLKTKHDLKLVESCFFWRIDKSYSTTPKSA